MHGIILFTIMMLQIVKLELSYRLAPVLLVLGRLEVTISSPFRRRSLWEIIRIISNNHLSQVLRGLIKLPRQLERWVAGITYQFLHKLIFIQRKTMCPYLNQSVRSLYLVNNLYRCKIRIKPNNWYLRKKFLNILSMNQRNQQNKRQDVMKANSPYDKLMKLSLPNILWNK